MIYRFFTPWNWDVAFVEIKKLQAYKEVSIYKLYAPKENNPSKSPFFIVIKTLAWRPLLKKKLQDNFYAVYLSSKIKQHDLLL
jgi:hypothetical protein